MLKKCLMAAGIAVILLNIPACSRGVKVSIESEEEIDLKGVTYVLDSEAVFDEDWKVELSNGDSYSASKGDSVMKMYDAASLRYDDMIKKKDGSVPKEELDKFSEKLEELVTKYGKVKK